MENKKIICYVLLLVIALIICYLRVLNVTEVNISHALQGKPPTPLINKQTEIKKAAFTLPKGYQPIKNTFEKTSYMGTTDHPTMDGGMINALDDIPIHYDQPEKKQVDRTAKEIARVDIQSQKPFQDTWAKNEKVKQLLHYAARDGKLEYVLKKADEKGLPASIAFLPIVESQYRNDAISPKGAAGAWQLMPSVAKQYGISKDDRFEFSIATDTVIRLLTDLHQQFNNWDLTFAAYNAGSRRISNALHKAPQAVNINDLDIPEETKNYVKRIKAISDALEEHSVQGA